MENSGRSNNNLVYFNSWSRKKYAVFNSLRKQIKVCTLLITYTIVCIPNFVNAQQDTINVISKEIDLEEVVVTGTRTPDIFSEVARIVTIIPKNEIEQAPVQSIADLLEYALNIDARQRGLFGVQTDLNIRGGTFDQVVVLLNGVNITDPQTGHYSLNLPVDIQSVERVEVLNGPSARIYGANAFNGAINIITLGKKDNAINASVIAGENGFYKVCGSGTFKTKNLQNFFSVAKMKSDGYADNTYFDISTLFYQAEYVKNFNRINIFSGLSVKEYGADYLPAFPIENEETQPVFINAGYSYHGNVYINSNLYFKQHNDHFQFLYDTIYYNYYHKNSIAGINSNVLFESSIGKSTIGIDVKREGIFSTTLGDLLDKPLNRHGIEYIKSFSRNSAGLFLNHEVELGKFFLSSGVMFSLISKCKPGFFPGIDVSYNFTKRLSVYGTVNKTLRIPTFTDLLYSSPDTYGNRELLAEKANTFEAGIKYKRDFIHSECAFFVQRADEIIDWVQVGVDSIWKIQHSVATKFDTIWNAQNISDLNTAGIDFSMAFNFNKLNNYNIIDQIKLYYGYLSINKNTNQYVSKYALDNLKHNASALVRIKITPNLFFNTKLTYHDRQGTFTLGRKQVPYKQVFLVDGRIGYNLKYLHMFLEISNLFNIQYYELGNQVQPGRWLRVGITMSKFFLKK